MRISEKKEYIAVDYCRLICAMLVVSIHLCPLTAFGEEASYWFNHVICRLAVPFFFICSGFFLEKKIWDKRKLCSYLLNVFILYLIYSVIYMPIAFKYFYSPELEVGIKINEYIKSFFLSGTYIHLWYLLALIVAAAILFFLVTVLKMSDKALVIGAVSIYAIGVLGNGYFGLLQQNYEFPTSVYYDYIGTFQTTRNGVFFGLPMMSAGYLIAKHSGRIKNIGYWKYFLISMVLLSAEAFVIYSDFDGWYKDMLFMLLPASVTLFLAVAFTECDNNFLRSKAIYARKTSAFIYFIHMLMYFAVIYPLYGKGVLLNSLEIYAIVIITSFIAGIVLTRISEYKYFKFLKYVLG